MGITAISGPQVCYGTVLSSSGATGEYNEQRGPSLCDLGEGLLDPRPQYSYEPGTGAQQKLYAWAGLFGGPVMDQAPSISSAASIAATQSATGVAGTFLTLKTTTTNTYSNAITPTTIIPATGTAAVSVLALDGVQNGQPFGSAGAVNLWDPTAAVTRGVSLTSTQSDGGSYKINGYDLYKFAMSWTSTGPNATTIFSPKAFKYIQNVQILTTGSTSVSVGTADLVGFPLRVDHPGYLTMWLGPSSAASQVTATTGNHTFASTGAFAVSSGSSTVAGGGADVRGTYLSTTAFTGSSLAAAIKLVMFISPSVQNLATVGTTNIWTGQSSGTNSFYGASQATGIATPAVNFAGLVGIPQI